ncbi:unnamed protein product [Calypogeia fissa]
MSNKLSEIEKEVQLRSPGDASRKLLLKDVVADCERRWFEAALKAALSGEVEMQTLVGQMFCSGYGVPVDMKKGKYWLQKSAGTSEDARKSLSNLSVGKAAMDSQTLPTST